MCYYKSYKPNAGTLFKGLELADKSGIREAVRSGFEYGDWPVVIDPADGITAAHWEFIPFWNRTWKQVEEARKKFTTLNAQGEKLLESKMYAGAARERRCLVVATGFYEWRHYKPATAAKENAYPYFITINSVRPFFFAGIYQPWTDKETGEMINTFATVTGPSNELMTQIHNKKKRQPTILTGELAEAWLSPSLSDSEIKELSVSPFPHAEMRAYTITKDFRQMEDPMEPFNYAELPALLL